MRGFTPSVSIWPLLFQDFPKSWLQTKDNMQFEKNQFHFSVSEALKKGGCIWIFGIYLDTEVDLDLELDRKIKLPKDIDLKAFPVRRLPSQKWSAV